MTRLAFVWLRGALRHPLRGLVVMVTVAIMALGAAAALVASASLEQLFVADAHAEWGQVDVEVTSSQDGIIELPTARGIAREAGVLVAASAPRLVLRGVVDAGQREPDALVLGLGAEEQGFAPLSARAGASDVLALGPGEALVNQRLAGRTGIEPGDQVVVHVAVPRTIVRDPTGGIEQIRRERTVPVALTVRGVVADVGVADLHRTPNLLLRRDVLQRELDFGPHVTAVHIAAAGDDPAAATDLIRQIESYARVFDLDASPVLLDQLAIAEDEGGQFQAILFTLAALVLIAAGIATAQMLTALAEDRSGEVGLLRTMGVGSHQVAGMVTIEAAVYATVGAVLGVVAAAPLANGLAGALGTHFAALAAGRGREQVALPTGVDPGLLVAGALLVVAVGTITGLRAGQRLAAVDVDDLLRGPVQRLPAHPLGSRRPTIVSALGWLLLGFGLPGGPASDALRYLGVTLLGLAWWMRRRRRGDPTRVDDRFAALGLAWATIGAWLFADFSQGFETGFGIMVVAGLVAVASVAGVLSRRFRGVLWYVRTLAPRGAWQVALRTAGAWAEEARGRTARLMATFGMVLFVAASLHVLGSAMDVPADAQAGGFDVIGTTVSGVDPLGLEQGIEGEAVAVPSFWVAEDAYGSRSGEDSPIRRVRYPVRLAVANQDLVTTQSFGLAASLPEYPTAQAALAAVVSDRDKAVVDRYALPPGAGVGDELFVDVGDHVRRFEVVAVLDTFLLDTMFVNLEEFHTLVPSVGANLVLASTDMQPAADLADQLEATYADHGMVVDTVAEAAADVVRVNRTFTDVFALVVLVGLAVAVVAVAASQARAARERHAALWVLRALGLPRWAIVAAVAVEPVAVALVGAVAGLAAGLAVVRLLFLVGFSQLAFVLDLTALAVSLGVLLTLLAMITTVTAIVASRTVTAPAEP